MRRSLTTVLGLLFGVHGLLMLFGPAAWFARIPGVPVPFNAHFVQDVGLAYLASGGGLLAFAWRSSYWPAALTAVGFQVGHAGLHVWGMLRGTGASSPQLIAFELATVVGPALLSLALVAMRERRDHATVSGP